VEAADQIYDGAMAVTCNILRELCGPAWRPSEVLLSHHEPEDTGPFQRFRTLNRRLAACGTTFQTLVEEARFGLARQLLEDTDLPLAQIAATLGYADASAFSRAFRRWSGTAPSRWRAKAHPRGR
jgi:hypothetical protein